MAKNSIGLSEPLESDSPVVIRRPNGTPDTPVPLLVTDIQSDNCTLEWKAPAWTGGEDLTNYLIEMRIGDSKSAEWKKLADLKPSLRSYTVQNLIESQEYYFRISACNSIGQSLPLELNRPVIPKKQQSPPSPPTGPITPLTINKDSITVQWGPPKSNGGSSITRYVVFYREVNKPNWIRSGHVDSQTFTHQTTGLIENSEYHFRVVAENMIGQSECLQTSEPIKAKSPYSVPSAPQGPIIISNLTANSAKVTWQRPSEDGGSPITGYLIKRRDVNRPVWVKCGRVGPDTHSILVRDLIEGCKYVVQIFAENSEGLSESLDSDTFEPKRVAGPPQPPANFECIGVDTDEVTLQWEAPQSDGGRPIKSYKIEQCEKNRKNWSLVKQDIPFINTSYCVRNLKENHDYLFRILAVNEMGESQWRTLEKAVRPRKRVEAPSTPTGPLKISSNDEFFTIGWNESKKDGGCPISNYVIEVRDANKANWSQIATVNAYTNQYKLTNLDENNDYFVRVRAQNEASLSSQGLESETPISLKSAHSRPGPVRQLKHTISNNKLTLEFIEPETNGGIEIRSYLIEKRERNRVTWIKVSRLRHESNRANYTYEIDDLNPGNYYFRVIAENMKGKSEPVELVDLVNIEKEAEAPSKPLDVQIVKKKTNSVSIEWKAPVYNGNDSLSEYLIEQYSSDSKEWTLVATCLADQRSYTVHNLKQGVNYKFRVRAVNKAGQSEPSLETIDTCITKDSQAPDAPTGPLNYTISEDNTYINLSWSEPKSNGGSRIRRYLVEKKINSEWFKVGFTTDTSFKCIDYFIEENYYSFRISAENDAGRSQPLELKNPILIKKTVAKPDKVSFLRIKEKSIDSVTLGWKSFSIAEIDNYVIEKLVNNEWIKIGTSKADSFVVNDLVANTNYLLRVYAVNSCGESESVEINVMVDLTDELPSKPISIGVDEINQHSVTLSWISPKRTGSKPIIGYKIFKLASGNAHWSECGHVIKSKKLNFTVLDLEQEFEYRFKVCAYNELGMGEASLTEKVQLKKPLRVPSEPVGLQVKSVKDGQISFSWMSPSSTGGSPITGYVIERAEIVRKEEQTEEGYTITADWLTQDLVDKYTLDYTIKNLSVGGLYSIRVAAENLVGQGPFAEIVEPVVAKSLFSRPNAPLGPISITNITRETVDASWHAPSNITSPLLSYFIEKKDIRENIWIKVARVDPDIRSLKIINLVEGRDYEIRVSAENEHGRSDPLYSDKFRPSRLYELSPSANTPWISLTNAKPYIDELYIIQELKREEYFFRVYAEDLLSTVWESINFSDLENLNNLYRFDF